jgi:hypothetical protein
MLVCLFFPVVPNMGLDNEFERRWMGADEVIVRDQWGNLRPRLVRRSSNRQVLDSLLTLKTEQRYIS